MHGYVYGLLLLPRYCMFECSQIYDIIRLGKPHVGLKGKHLLSSFIPASNRLWVFAGLPMSTHVNCSDKKWPDKAAYFNSHVPSLLNCFWLSKTAALPSNWDWSNEQSASFWDTSDSQYSLSNLNLQHHLAPTQLTGQTLVYYSQHDKEWRDSVMTV